MKTKVLGLLAVGLLAGPLTANAVVITISGQGSANGQWDVSTQSGTFGSLATTLDDQVWWGNESLAGAFTAALGLNLGKPNSNGAVGPIFAYAGLSATNQFDSCAFIEGFNDPVRCGSTSNGESSFAFASRVAAVPEPGTLALLGLGLAGLGLSRRRKAA